MRTLCLGEALVDMVCERHVASLTDADAFVPHFGGAVANVCVSSARAGGRPALAGGAGDDAWGAWLRDRLEGEGVDLTWFALMEGVATPIAFVAVDDTGEPEYSIYAGGIGETLTATADRVLAAVEQCDGLFLTSNNLVGEAEREMTLEARTQALDWDRPIVFDPNLRLGRWETQAAAVAQANACVPGALLVRANRAEAEAMTGEADPERAATALLKAGARLVVITLGPGGAILRGELTADAPGRPVENVLSTVGAGDAFMGVILARLEQTGYYPAAIAAALPDAVRTASEAVGRWGAV